MDGRGRPTKREKGEKVKSAEGFGNDACVGVWGSARGEEDHRGNGSVLD